MILFTNPGELDIRAATTLGVNVKEGYNPIGFFGTGLKYAIAVLLRSGHTIHIRSGNTCYGFRTKPVEIRSKTFNFIELGEHASGEATSHWRELGFTTELGKTWELWQVYRELYSNTEDEHGEIHKIIESKDSQAFVGPGQTVILISGPEFDKTHERRFEFLLDKDRRPLLETEHIQVFSGMSDYIFYQGIRAMKLSKPARYTYNMLEKLALTEDRTISDTSRPPYRVGGIMLEGHDKEIITTLVNAGENYFEGELYPSTFFSPSEEFFEVMRRSIATNPLGVNKRAQALYYDKKRGENKEHTFIEFTPDQTEEVNKALALCERLGYNVRNYKIRLAESLGTNIFGLAYRGEILLCPLTFEMGMAAEAIVEEYIHLSTGYKDESRAMQSYLFREIIRLGKELQS